MNNYDLIIRNGSIIDGTGAASMQADIAIKGGKIALIQASIESKAAREIDATGMIITPGFVDVHTHYDGQATWDTHLNPSSNLGTTTVVMGNCGVGFAPCRPEDRDVLVKLMEGVEEIPESAMSEGLPWTWETFPEFLDCIESRPHDIDLAALVPHGPLRVYVMGERGVNREPATEDDIAKMKALLAESVAAGGVGFSTSRTLVHRSSTGDFVPTYQAVGSELVQITQALAGDQGHVFQFIADWQDADDEFSILTQTAETTGAKGTFTLLDIATTPDLWHEQLKRIEAAQAKGLDIYGQVLSRPVGIMMGHQASMSPFYDRPSFKALNGLPWDEKIAALHNPDTKASILSESNDNPHIFVKLVRNNYNNMYVLEDPIEYLPDPKRCISALAAAENRDAEEWLYDYFLTNNGNALIYIPGANFSENIPEMLGHPRTVAALGDGGAHVGSICDASANLFLLSKWVKEQGCFSLEQGVQMVTRQPAELYSLYDRGILAPGMKADINVIDFENLQLHRPHITYDLPAGGKRFLQRADGIKATIVSGEIIYQDGEPTGALPGKLIRGAQNDPRVQ